MAAGLAHGSAPAADWRFTGATSTAAAFVDAATLVRDRSWAEIWQYTIVRAPVNGIKASKRRKRVDCATLESRLLQTIEYDEEGRAGPPLVYTRLPQVFTPARDVADLGAHRFACGEVAKEPPSLAAASADPLASAAAIFAASAASP